MTTHPGKIGLATESIHSCRKSPCLCGGRCQSQAVASWQRLGQSTTKHFSAATLGMPVEITGYVPSEATNQARDALNVPGSWQNFPEKNQARISEPANDRCQVSGGDPL